MTELEKVNAYCFGLIKIAHETNAPIMTIKQENVHHKGEFIGNWEIIVKQA